MLLSGDNPLVAYQGLWEGAFGSGRAWATTVRKIVPFTLAGLSVAVAFKAGLFNIGAAGQFLMGSVFSVFIGVNFEGLPAYIHLPLALLFGILGGMLWGAIPGILKVYTGAHEVIVTIMLNYVASLFAGWTVYAGGTQGQRPGPLWDPTAGAISETPDVLMSARIPWLFEPPYRVHYGVFIALFAVIFIWWLIYKTTIGFEIRTVGQNLRAARYAGMRVNWILIFTIALAGGLAGLAGAIETLGLNHKFAPEFGGGVGFDGITVALLGQTHPFGVLLAAFLFGAMDAGAARMQFQSGVAADIIQVIQALILAMVAAPAIIRMIYRIRQVPAETDATKLSQGWGGS
ncbi:MAG: ABC transporter permease [Caldilineaceae bacterium]|nr:ABC transporter permease [Caldilineaceae bacterium]